MDRGLTVAALAYFGAVVSMWASIYVVRTVTTPAPSCAVPTDKLTPILSFLGAIIVAIIGAVVAWHRNGDPPPRRRRTRADA